MREWVVRLASRARQRSGVGGQYHGGEVKGASVVEVHLGYDLFTRMLRDGALALKDEGRGFGGAFFWLAGDALEALET